MMSPTRTNVRADLLRGVGCADHRQKPVSACIARIFMRPNDSAVRNSVHANTLREQRMRTTVIGAHVGMRDITARRLVAERLIRGKDSIETYMQGVCYDVVAYVRYLWARISPRRRRGNWTRSNGSRSLILLLAQSGKVVQFPQEQQWVRTTIGQKDFPCCPPRRRHQHSGRQQFRAEPGLATCLRPVSLPPRPARLVHIR